MDNLQIVYEFFNNPFFVVFGVISVILAFPLLVGLFLIVLVSVIDCWLIGFRGLLRLGFVIQKITRKCFKKRS